MLSSVGTPFTPNFCGSSLNQSTYLQPDFSEWCCMGWTREQWITMIPLFISNVLCTYTGTQVALRIGTISSTQISGFLIVPGHVSPCEGLGLGQDKTIINLYVSLKYH